MKIVYWSVTESGYDISVQEFHLHQTIEEYHAGNSPFDSGQYLPVGHEQAISYKKLREYAELTAKDMAEEHGVPMGLIEEDEDSQYRWRKYNAKVENPTG